MSSRAGFRLSLSKTVGGGGESLLPLVSLRHPVTIATHISALSTMSPLWGLLAYGLYIFPIILKRVKPSHLHPIFTYCSETDTSSCTPSHTSSASLRGREDEWVQEAVTKGHR